MATLQRLRLALVVLFLSVAASCSERSEPVGSVGSAVSGIVYAQSNAVDDKTSGTATSVTFPSHTGGSTVSSFLLAAPIWSSTGVACGSSCVTDSQGNAWTCLPTKSAPFGYDAALCYAPVSGAGGADTVTMHTAGTVAERLLYVYEYQGVAGADASCEATGTTASASCSLTTTAASDWLFGQEIDKDVGTAGSGFVARDTAFGNVGEDKAAGSAGAYSVTASSSGSSWAIFGLAMKPAATSVALSFRQSTAVDDKTSGTSTSLAFGSSTGGSTVSSFLIAASSWSSTSVACGSPCVTDAQGNAWTCLATETAPFGYNTTLCYAPVKGAGGADTVTVHTAATVAERVLYVYEYQGVLGTDGSCKATGTTSTASCSLTTTASNDWLFGQEMDRDVGTAGSGFIARDTAYGNVGEDKSAGSAGSYGVTAGSSGSSWAIFGLALKGGSGGGGGGGGGSPYPLRASSNNRYLVDQKGNPFLLTGDSPQALIGNVSETDASTYFANRAAKGFNAVWINLLCGSYTGCNANGTTYDGIAPFTSGSSPSTYDLSKPNPAYFQRVDDMVNLAAQNGLTVFLDPIETGAWLVTLQNNGATKDQAYGQYVGGRYASFPNIVWLLGNDFDINNTTNNGLLHDVGVGIHGADTNHLITLEGDGGCSTDDSLIAPLLGIDGAYTYDPTYDQDLKCYNKSGHLPAFLLESNYEGGTICDKQVGGTGINGTPFHLRRQEYWTMTSGATGYVNGNDTWITFFSPGWQNNLNTPGMIQFGYWHQFWSALPWWNMVPDQSHTLVTAGYGSYTPLTPCTTDFTSDYVTATLASDGSTAVVSFPESATITVDMARFTHASVTAKWFDPSANTYTTASGSPFSNSGSRQFASPGNNGAGDPDWVLLFQ